jgi:hypothetical protein
MQKHYTESIRSVVSPGSLKEEDLRRQLLWILHAIGKGARGINMPRLREETRERVHELVGNVLFDSKTTWSEPCSSVKAPLGSEHMFIFYADEDSEKGDLVLRGINNRGKLVLIRVSFIPEIYPPVITQVYVTTCEYWEIGSEAQSVLTSDEYFGAEEHSVACYLFGLTSTLDRLVDYRRESLFLAEGWQAEADELERLVSATKRERNHDA